MLQTAFGTSCMNGASVFEWHKRFKKPGSLWAMMRGVGGVRKSIHQSWLAKSLGLGLLCWGFKGVQEEIPSEETITLQIGSVAFPPRQCTSPQLHPCDFCLFLKLRGCHYERIEEMKEAVTKVIDALTQEDIHWAFQKLLERYNKCIAAGEDYFEGVKSFMCVLSMKVPIRKSLETYLMILVYIYSLSLLLHIYF